MNTLSNGALAIGQEGSWMRFHGAYEHELTKALDAGQLRLKPGESVSDRATMMMVAIRDRHATLGGLMTAAALACGVKPTERAIREYLQQASRGMSHLAL